MHTKEKKSLGHVIATKTNVVIIKNNEAGRQPGKPVFRQTEMKVLKVN